MRIVVALGGNALLRRGEPVDAEVQLRNVRAAASSLCALADHELVVTHGNGPQVGLLALQSAESSLRLPLDVLDAESEGMVGYLIEGELRNALPKREVATLLTEMVVDAADPAFAHPSKPIGPGYTAAAAHRLARRNGWCVGRDGERWRRLVPSPEPRAIVELSAIRILLDAGVIVICVGGGGIPVVRSPSGTLRGAEAVVDKDLAAALLAKDVRADALLLLTDVDAVYRAWGTPSAAPITDASPSMLRSLSFAAGSMAPKVEAACRFVEAGGAFAGIGALEQAQAIMRHEAGTMVSF